MQDRKIKTIMGYDIYLDKQLGNGSYGVVCEAKSHMTEEIVAIKMIKKAVTMNEKQRNSFLNEVQISQQVTGDHVLQAIEILQSSNFIYIVTEKCESDLRKLMTRKGEMQQKEAIGLLKQIVAGMIDLVRNGVIHRDLKPENILVDFKGVLKICDFGVSKRNTALNMQNHTYTGTPSYQSLELALAQQYTTKCDVWAIGIIFYEFLHGRHPWFQKDNSIYSNIQKIQTQKLKINPKISKLSQDFLMQTLQLAEKDRLSWKEVFSHPIFNNQFKQYLVSSQKKEFKLKVLMNKLRHQVNTKDIDVEKHLCNIIKLPNIQKVQLNFKDFILFIKQLEEDTTEEEIRFFFDRIDLDQNGSISVQEIKAVMNEEKIKTKQSKVRQIFTLPGTEASEETKKIAKSFFQHLHKILLHKNTSLEKTFNAYDKEKKKRLTLQNFKNMISRVSKSTNLTEAEIESVFELIDKDRSRTVEYDELFAFYCEANGIDPTTHK